MPRAHGVSGPPHLRIFIPSGSLDEFGCAGRTPSDIRGIVELMKCLATRNTFLEGKASQQDFSNRSQSSPADFNRNAPVHDAKMLDLQYVADVSDTCATDWEFYEDYATCYAADSQNWVGSGWHSFGGSPQVLDISSIALDSVTPDSFFWF